jgi:DNA invertase Pin-like site-specific DNA recombinase
MNALIYLRVSTKEEAEKGDSEEGYSIPAQREACLRACAEKGAGKTTLAVVENLEVFEDRLCLVSLKPI